MHTAVLGAALFPARLQAAAPANDNFSSPAELTGSFPFVALADSSRATLEDWEGSNFDSGASLWWAWTSTDDIDVIASTGGSTFDTDLYVFQITADGFDYIDYNDDERSTTLTSRVRFSAQKGGRYLFRIGDYDGTGGRIRFSLAAAEPWIVPNWSLNTPTGGGVSWSQFADKVVIINLWATWCVPCLNEMPDLVRLQEKYRNQGFEIVGFATDTSADRVALVKQAMANLHINYSVVMSTPAVETMFEQVNSIPLTYIVNRSGRVVGRFVGTQSYQTFEAAIKPLLAANTAAPPPNLDILVPVNGAIQLSWRKSVRPIVVQDAAAPLGPWTNRSELPATLSADVEGITMDAPTSPRFFRLHLQ